MPMQWPQGYLINVVDKYKPADGFLLNIYEYEVIKDHFAHDFITVIYSGICLGNHQAYSYCPFTISYFVKDCPSC